MKSGVLKYKAIVAGIAILFLITELAACKKTDDWLDQKRQKSDVVPQTLSDFQAMLDNYYAMNKLFPTIGMAGIDNFYVTDNNLNSADQVERNCYIWAQDIFQGTSSYDWSDVYTMVEYANIVLDGLMKITPDISTQSQFNNLKGSALFYRSIAFYLLSQIYCKPYTAATAASDLGIPVRLTSDVNIKSVRASVKDTYNQMTSDLLVAISLLPKKPQMTMRPCEATANALLAKIYLSMEDYVNALAYSKAALALSSTLLDYNSSLVNPSSTFRFPAYPGNPEVQFYAEGNGEGYDFITPVYNISYVDTLLYQSYDSNDLRKSVLFLKNGGHITFAGTYTGTFYPFAGIATNEIYLIRAECFARTGDAISAMGDLDTLLKYRYKTGTFVPIAATNADSALSRILTERRKELPLTGNLRWEDLRRLNKDSKFAVTLKHISGGTTYTLSPNDPRYVYPISNDEVQLSGIAQNVR